MHILCPHCHNPIEVVKITPREEIACPACGSTFHLETESTTGWERQAGQRLGKFELLDTLGSGAFGTVYKARDPELDRTVAIKVPRAGNLAGPQELDRFLREARIVAQLRHPSIVPVHEVGESGGVPYRVSDFVRGVTLADLLSARRPGFREAAELVAAVADALQYAHEQGVVHRDVKPSNIMIGDDGSPFVMDFGLAKREAGEVTMTVEGQILGTPAYMSPEQARGEGHAVDARGDVYSLGVVLYQLLTGELPFRGTQRMLLHQVLYDDPRLPRSLNDHIPRDLQTITLKAMAKEPARRYATARDLADDLRRWLSGEPIRARPVGRWERAARWVRRRPAAAALLVVSGVAALAVVGLAVGVVYSTQLNMAYKSEAAAHVEAEEARGRAEVARQAEEEQRKRAEDALTREEAARQAEERERIKAEAAQRKAEGALEVADQISYSHSILLAELALRENAVLRAKGLLEECKPKRRRWEWYYLRGQCHNELFSFPGAGPVFSPDGTRIMAVGYGGVRVYDVRTGREALALKGPATLSSPVFSPDGTRIMAVDRDGVVRVYDARTGQEVLAIEGPTALRDPVFSPDGTRIAATSGGGDGVVRVYDARTGQEALALRGVSGPVFSPDGTRIAATSGGGDGVVRVYDARTGREALVLKGPTGLDLPVFSPDGTRIAAWPRHQGGDGVVRVYDARTGQEALALKGLGPLGSPVFSPDGARLAASDRAGVVRVYDARTGQEALALKGLAGLGRAVFSPDGARLAASDRAGVVRVHDARTGQQVLVVKGPAALSAPVFSPDGTRIAAGPRDAAGVVRVFDAQTGQEALALKGPAPLGSPVFSPDGARIAVGPMPLTGDHRVVRVYDARTGKEALALEGPAPLGSPAFSPDGVHIAVGPMPTRGDGVVRVYDARTGREVLALKGPAPLGRPVFSPDGARIIVGPMPVAGDGVVRVFDARSGQEVLALRRPGLLNTQLKLDFFSVDQPVLSPDGSRVAVADRDGVVWVWTAPEDPTAWQAERRQALADSVLTWHRTQATESLAASQWFAAAFHLGRLIEAEPASGLHHYRRGFALIQLARTAEADKEFEKALVLKDDLPELAQADAHAMLAQWEAAAKLYAKAVEQPNTPPLIWYRHALLRLQVGDRAGYSKACATMLERFGKIKNPAVANLVAWTCALGPDALSDLKPAVDLARMTVQANPKDYAVRNTLGAILYRAGRHAEAVAELNESIKMNDKGGTSIDFPFLAMAHHRLGKAEEAKKWLDQAAPASEKPSSVMWWDRLEGQLLRREAEALLKEPAPEPKK